MGKLIEMPNNIRVPSAEQWEDLLLASSDPDVRRLLGVAAVSHRADARWQPLLIIAEQVALDRNLI